MRFTSKAFYVARLYGVSPPSLRVFMKLSADNLLVFKWSQGPVQFSFNLQEIKRIMSRTIKILNSNWLRTQKLSQFLQAGKVIFFSFFSTKVTLYVPFLCSDWSIFDRWVYAEILCSIWKLVYW